jgi:hypothetical protein
MLAQPVPLLVQEPQFLTDEVEAGEGGGGDARAEYPPGG